MSRLRKLPKTGSSKKINPKVAKLNYAHESLYRFSKFSKRNLTIVVLLVALVGLVMLLASHAAGPSVSVESENGTLKGQAHLNTGNNVSGGSYVQFGERPVSPMVFYKNPSLSSLAGHTAINAADGGSGIPNNQTVCFAYGLGPSALSQPVGWDVSDFTGLNVPNPLDSQRGINGSVSGYGSSACQVNGTSVGFLVNRELAPESRPVQGMQVDYHWGSPTIRPWSNAYPANAHLRIQTHYAAGSRVRGNATQYVQMTFGLHDIVSKHGLWWVISLWDSRGINPENVHGDAALGGTTSQYVVGTHITTGTQYATMAPGSQNGRGDSTCGCDLYAVDITKANFLNAINKLNTNYSLGLSTDPNNYLLTLVGVGPEEYNPIDNSGWMSTRVWDLLAQTEF